MSLSSYFYHHYLHFFFKIAAILYQNHAYNSINSPSILPSDNDVSNLQYNNASKNNPNYLERQNKPRFGTIFL